MATTYIKVETTNGGYCCLVYVTPQAERTLGWVEATVARATAQDYADNYGCPAVWDAWTYEPPAGSGKGDLRFTYAAPDTHPPIGVERNGR